MILCVGKEASEESTENERSIPVRAPDWIIDKVTRGGAGKQRITSHRAGCCNTEFCQLTMEAALL